MSTLQQDDLSFGSQLRRYRERAGLTQEALAERAGLTANAISALESGARRRPYPHTVAALAQALQLSAAEHTALLTARAPQRGTTAHAPQSAGAPPAAGSQPPPLLTTKLYRPQLRAAGVARPHLVSRLDAGLAGPLTLIAAPAGFGKTTLLAAWLTEQEQRGTAVAWLALDAADADPIRLLRYLIAALQAVLPGVGQPLLPLLGAGQLPPLATLLPLLVNDLLALPDPSILVLDDYHTIDAPAVHQALAYLLDHLPPQLHLVLATRVDPPLPLARLRARGQLTELRADDLRFSSEEAATFLREVMGLSLSVAEVVALEGRTEGWVAGLQLAALSLRDRPSAQRTAFIDAFTGSHRFVVDYLVDEVLARQPAHLQHFLLHTAILERLCSPLCDAVVRAAAPTDAPAAGMEAAGSESGRVGAVGA